MCLQQLVFMSAAMTTSSKIHDQLLNIGVDGRKRWSRVIKRRHWIPDFWQGLFSVSWQFSKTGLKSEPNLLAEICLNIMVESHKKWNMRWMVTLKCGNFKTQLLEKIERSNKKPDKTHPKQRKPTVAPTGVPIWSFWMNYHSQGVLLVWSWGWSLKI